MSRSSELAREKQMVRSIDPRRVTLRQSQWPFKAVAELGTRVAETILASGYMRPHTKAAHMEARDPIKNICKNHLQVGAVHIWNWAPLAAAENSQAA